MKIKLDEIKCKIPYEKQEFYKLVQDEFLKIDIARVYAYEKFGSITDKFIDDSNTLVLKKSLDARKKPMLYDVYGVLVFWDEEDVFKLTQSLFSKSMSNKGCESKGKGTLNDKTIWEIINMFYYCNDFRGSNNNNNSNINNNSNNTNNDLNNIYKNQRAEYSSDYVKNKDMFDAFFSGIIKNHNNRPVVVGSGPAGLFAALKLADQGFNPILIERGKAVDERILDINEFWDNGKLNPISNVQFGEGGAGTFSDGKLTTGIKSPLCRVVLETFVDGGAPNEILYMTKPHIGTDLLRGIVKSIRNRIIELGGTVLFETKLTNINIENSNITGIEIEYLGKSFGDVSKFVISDLGNDNIHYIENSDDAKRQIISKTKLLLKTNNIILATGHSARDTIKMLHNKGLGMQSKPFSMGVRIEHLQDSINESQYGKQDLNTKTKLPAAEYKLSYHLPNGRDVYTFCMCPGGQVIASSSMGGQVVTNGMSLYSRAQKNSNSAVLVNVTPKDFDNDHPLAGIDFQEKWENKTYIAGGENYFAPAQYVGSFLGKREIVSNKKVIPSYTPGVKWTSIASCLPDFVAEAIKESLPIFDKKLKNFADDGAVMTAIESRSSSPVRILRDENLQSNILGIYPCGEGAGYAGGIMSAAVDGIRCADACVENLNKTSDANKMQ